MVIVFSKNCLTKLFSTSCEIASEMKHLQTIFTAILKILRLLKYFSPMYLKSERQKVAKRF